MVAAPFCIHCDEISCVCVTSATPTLCLNHGQLNGWLDFLVEVLAFSYLVMVVQHLLMAHWSLITSSDNMLHSADVAVLYGRGSLCTLGIKLWPSVTGRYLSSIYSAVVFLFVSFYVQRSHIFMKFGFHFFYALLSYQLPSEVIEASPEVYTSRCGLVWCWRQPGFPTYRGMLCCRTPTLQGQCAFTFV